MKLFGEGVHGHLQVHIHIDWGKNCFSGGICATHRLVTEPYTTDTKGVFRAVWVLFLAPTHSSDAGFCFNSVIGLPACVQ